MVCLSEFSCIGKGLILSKAEVAVTDAKVEKTYKFEIKVGSLNQG